MATLPEKINGHRDQHVRRALSPLADMAERLGLAILPVIHFNKAPGSDALLRVGGSIAFVAASRSVLAFGYDPEDPDGEQGDQRVWAAEVELRAQAEGDPLRSRGARLRPEGRDDLHVPARVRRGVRFTAGEFFASRDPEERLKEDDARDWLIGRLRDGEWHLSADVKEDGERKKQTVRTLQRAVHRMAEEGEAEVKKRASRPAHIGVSPFAPRPLVPLGLARTQNHRKPAHRNK